MSHWFKEAGGDIRVNTLKLGKTQIATRVDDSNPFWVAFEKSATEA